MIKDCTKSYNDSEESGVKLNYFDNKIDQFATYLQKRNNLDHIQFLQVRLGMQVLAKNIGKLIVMYTIAYILNIFSVYVNYEFNILFNKKTCTWCTCTFFFLVLCRKYYTIYTFTFSNSKFSY